MNKLIIKIIFVVYILLSLSCSYKPIFSEKNYNFGLEEVTFIEKGEKDANRIIKNKLDLIKKVNDKKLKKYILSIKTFKTKKIFSKDSKGDPVKFELILTTDYTIKENEEILLNKSINKRNIYDNNSDKFKLQQTEKIILENLANSTSDIILSSIIILNDN